MYSVTILCLANSRKPPSGRCIAGKTYAGGTPAGWVRPVSARPSHEVSEEERRYQSGTKAQLLDIISVPLLNASPLGHQVENHTLADTHYWVKQGSATWDQVEAAVDAYDQAFWSYSQSTNYGWNDKVSAADVVKLGSSLKLIKADDLVISVKTEPGFQGAPGRRRARGKFSYRGVKYWMSLTDPEIEEQHLKAGDGEYPIGEAALCISVVEVWNGFAFRVIASVITPARCKMLNAS